MTKCGECGYENIDGLDYCDGCGAKLEASASAAAAAPPAVEPSAPPEPPAAPSPSEPEAPAAMMDAPGEPAVAAEPALAPEPVVSPPASDAPTGEIKPPPAPPAEPVAAAMPSHFKSKLSVVRGGRKGQEFPLEDGNNLVGRWDPETGAFPEVDLDQDDPEAKISRKHALIRIENAKITVEDIGSLNGTYVNRQPRLQPGNPVELKAGDEIIIGKTFLKLVVEPIS
ncbi:MAG TPA: FHA domain-containing protein [Candidatus Binataceae bacterium]|nr:FHA domain-containing protein [Candidatus Binataceae bacterium]